MPSVDHHLVGRVRFEALSKGRIQILDGWASQNISTVFIPQLKGVPTYGGRFSGNVRWHRKGVAQLKAAWAAVEAAGLLSRVIFWDGSFVPRMKRGSRTSPSNHTFGTAFDINAEWNGFRQPYARKGHKGSVVELVPIFEAHGFLWGGNWRGPSDGMHFELKRWQDVPVVPAVAPAPAVEPKLQAPSVILVGPEGGKRVATTLIGGRNFASVRDVLSASGVVIAKEGRWEDGTPALYIKE